MNKFFTSQQVYEDRLAICKACDYYFKPTGSCKVCKCFMKIKARIAPMACGSCLSTAYDAIKKLYIKYNKI